METKVTATTTEIVAVAGTTTTAVAAVTSKGDSAKGMADQPMEVAVTNRTNIMFILPTVKEDAPEPTAMMEANNE